LKDNYLREINYLRVSITDRCNLRCIYCMPAGGVEKLWPHEDILRNEELVSIIAAAASQAGIRKIRLTGGEPLIRRGLVDLVAAIRDIPGIDDIALTTNGILLPNMGKELKEAGLQRVNISLDTLDPALFRHLTRNGDLEQVWRGIENALEQGFSPVKINTVVMKGYNDHEIGELAALTVKYPLHVRFIELMPVGASNSWAGDRHVPVSRIKEIIEAGLGSMESAYQPTGNGPARYYRLSGAPGTIGFISPVSDHFCKTCNRLRLTAEGMIRPCLYSGWEIDIKGLLRKGATDTELGEVFRQAIGRKPDRHCISAGWQDDKKVMSQIGG